MLAVRLEPAIEAELTKLVLETGRSNSYYVKEALAVNGLQIEFLATAKRELNKFDIRRQQAILDYLEDEIAGLENPRNRGKALVGDKQALWRYRVADYRIICEIRDAELIIVAVTIGHRKTCMSKLTKPDGVRSVAKQKLKNVY